MSLLEKVDAALASLAADGWTVYRGRLDAAARSKIGEEEWKSIIVETDEDLPRTGQPEEELSFAHSGPSSDIQVAFARQGLCPLVPVGTEGVFILNPSDPGGSDLVALLEALKPLEEQDWFVGPATADTPSEGWSDAEESGCGSAVFWTRDAHTAAFSKTGRLDEELHLQWRGDGDVLAEVLEGTLLEVERPEDDNSTFIVRP